MAELAPPDTSSLASVASSRQFNFVYLSFAVLADALAVVQALSSPRKPESCLLVQHFVLQQNLDAIG